MQSHAHSLGDTRQLVMAAPQIAGATLATAAALHASWATAIIPIVGPIIAGVTIALSLLFARKGPKQKVATTQIVDAVEPELARNRDAYLATPNRNRAMQAQALANFEAGWAYVVEHCDTPVMGEPGQRCVSDRTRGGRWDWWSYYYDPIANDTPPGDAPAQSSGGFVAALTKPWLLLAGAAMFAFAIAGRSE